MPRRVKTLDQVKAMLKKAERFALDVLQDPEKAEEFGSMAPDEYAERKGIEIRNAAIRARKNSAERTDVMTKPELESLLDEVDALLEDALDPRLSREELVEKVMEASEIITGEEEEEDDQEAAEDGEEDCPRRRVATGSR
jgi:hypothetical protein